MDLKRNTKWIGGQGMVEFALVLPILLLLVVGALDFGRAFYIKVGLENAAREGAYYMVYHPEDRIGPSFPAAQTAVQVEAQDSGFPIATNKIVVKCMQGGTQNNACPSGSTVIVTVQYEFQFVVSRFFGGPIQLTNEARMLIP